MKSKSTSAIIRSIRAKHKKHSYRQAAGAIERKLVEIKKSSKEHSCIQTTMALFGHLAWSYESNQKFVSFIETLLMNLLISPPGGMTGWVILFFVFALRLAILLCIICIPFLIYRMGVRNGRREAEYYRTRNRRFWSIQTCGILLFSWSLLSWSSDIVTGTRNKAFKNFFLSTDSFLQQDLDISFMDMRTL